VGLAQLKGRAIRRGVWFRRLTKLNRAMVDLTILCVAKARTSVLSKVLATTVCKILKALRSRYLEAIRAGMRLALRASEFAESGGYRKA